MILTCLLLWSAGLLGCSPGTTVVQQADVVVFVPAELEADAMRAAAEAYQQETGRVVKVVVTGSDAYLNELEGALLAGRSDIDLAYLPASRLPLWVSYRALQPVMDTGNNLSIVINAQSNEILRPWLSNLTIANQVYGFPTQPALEALWYREDLFQSAGLQPPVTWEAFYTAAQVLNRPPDRFGAALAAGPYGPGFEFGAVLAGFGGRLFGTPQGGLPGDLRNPPEITLALDQPETQQALVFYSGLFQPGAPVAPGSLDANRAAAAAALQEGRAAMAILPVSMAAALLDCQAGPRACTTPETGPAQSLLAFAPLPGLPQGVATGELGAWVIPLNAAHAQAARDFGAWLVGPSGALAWAENGGIPAGVDEALLQAAGQAPYLALLAGIREYRLPYPPVRRADQVETVLYATLHAALKERLEPAEAASRLADGLRSALYRGGYTVK